MQTYRSHYAITSIVWHKEIQTTLFSLTQSIALSCTDIITRIEFNTHSKYEKEEEKVEREKKNTHTQSDRKMLEGSFRLFVYKANLIRLHITCRHCSRSISNSNVFLCKYTRFP